MNGSPQNIFTGICEKQDGEIFQNLVSSGDVCIERIISDGHTTPSGEWYDQNRDEWVMLVAGCAIIRYEDSAELIFLKPGDYLLIPAGRRHRVERTAEGQKTIWLAVHFNAEKPLK